MTSIEEFMDAMSEKVRGLKGAADLASTILDQESPIDPETRTYELASLVHKIMVCTHLDPRAHYCLLMAMFADQPVDIEIDTQTLKTRVLKRGRELVN